jgi:hypothetical protein
MSIIKASTKKSAPKVTDATVDAIKAHAALVKDTNKRIRNLERKQLDVFKNADKAAALCRELRKIASLEWSVDHLSKVAEITRHAAASYCTIAKVLAGECNGKQEDLFGLVTEFEEGEPSSLTFFAFAEWLRKGKQTAPKPNKASVTIKGKTFQLKESELKSPKAYKANELTQAIKLLEKLTVKLKELQA